MGFNVDNVTKVVSVDHSHSNFANTAVDANPVYKTLSNDLIITSIFQRTKRRRKQDSLGDNCPMLYAFKGLQGLKTTYTDVKLLLSNFSQILGKHFQQASTPDLIIPIASSHPLPLILARRVSRNNPCSILISDSIHKVSAGNILEQVNNLTNVKRSDAAALRNDVKRFINNNGESADFQMKSVSRPHLRVHINPFAFSGINCAQPPNNILLVDDMITSGRSLECTADAISKVYPHAKISGLTLFGSSK